MWGRVRRLVEVMWRLRGGDWWWCSWEHRIAWVRLGRRLVEVVWRLGLGGAAARIKGGLVWGGGDFGSRGGGVGVWTIRKKNSLKKTSQDKARQVKTSKDK